MNVPWENGLFMESWLVFMTVGSWLGAMLLGGLVTAHYRVSGLYHNGLIDEDSLGGILREYVRDDRRFQVTVGTLYLVATLLGALGWGFLLNRLWSGLSVGQFYGVFAVSAGVAWSLGGLGFKLVAARMALTYARVVGFLISPFNWLLRPWSSLLLAAMNRMDDSLVLGETQPHLSAGEIRTLISTDGPGNTLGEEDREMIQSIFSFHDTAVREIMIPRIDMVVMDDSLEIAEALTMVVAEGHSRVPVYDGGVDKVTGILYAKDLLRFYGADDEKRSDVHLSDLAREAYFIPESKKINEVLDEFRAKRIHMAIVIDEYGGTAGLVTLEDVIEEIVGEIEDEFDEEESLLSWVDARTVRLDPKLNLEDLADELGVDFADAEGAKTNETLGGIIYEAAGNVPCQGDVIEVAGFRITVEEVSDQRLLVVLMRYHQALPGFASHSQGEKE